MWPTVSYDPACAGASRGKKEQQKRKGNDHVQT
jgi:hypothetical protein